MLLVIISPSKNNGDPVIHGASCDYLASTHAIAEVALSCMMVSMSLCSKTLLHSPKFHMFDTMSRCQDVKILFFIISSCSLVILAIEACDVSCCSDV
jgi:hypothetical protein